MNALVACLTSSLLCLPVLTPLQVTAASGSSSPRSMPHERMELSLPEAARSNEMARPMAPADKPRHAPVPADPNQQVEERVRSGQMEPPIAQDEVSERLEQIERGSIRLHGDKMTGAPIR